MKSKIIQISTVIRESGIIILYAVIALAFYSCKKEEYRKKDLCGTTNTTSYIKSQDLTNCKYKTSSYWVFIDSVNLSYDSVYISNHIEGFKEITHCNSKIEHHSFNTVSYPSNRKLNYAVFPGGLFKNVQGLNGTQIYNQCSSNSSHSNYIANCLDSVFIYNQYYYNVMKVTIDQDGSERFKKSIYYINSDFGFLKHQMYEHSRLIANKILIRKNIIR